MSLLSIKASKKITITCSLEESTALQVNQYAAFLGVSADDVVDKALEYVFSKDRDFQQFREANKDKQAPAALRMKKPATAAVSKQNHALPSVMHGSKAASPTAP